MASRRTVPINQDADFESLSREITKLLARWGFVEIRFRGSTSWTAGASHPRFANETTFKLCYFGPEDVVWGIRKTFADQFEALAQREWPLAFTVAPSSVEFVGFACRDAKTTLDEVAEIVQLLGEPRPGQKPAVRPQSDEGGEHLEELIFFPPDAGQQPTAKQAAGVRAEWMRLMGVPEDEIAELCRYDPEHPFDLEEELRELEAAKKLAGNTPSYEDLLTWSRRTGAKG